MKERLISIETAKLAKAKGFEADDAFPLSHLTWVPNYEGVFVERMNISLHAKEIIGDLLICTQSLLQKWLREKHDIHIEVYHDGYAYDCSYHSFDHSKVLTRVDCGKMADNTFCKTYEEALERGLIEALKLC